MVELNDSQRRAVDLYKVKMILSILKEVAAQHPEIEGIKTALEIAQSYVATHRP